MKLIVEKFDTSAYDKYLKEHIGNVQHAYMLLVDNGIFEQDDSIQNQIKNHDKSKYEPEEYNAYGEYFYGSKKNVAHKDDKDFKYAWLHHQHNNPHHWQHWLLKEDESEQLEALDMPDNYIQEMICDWMAFSIAKKDIRELFKWYENNKSKQILSVATKTKVEKYLDKIKAANINLG